MNFLPIINTHFTLFGGHVETVFPGWKWKPEEHPAFELMYVIAGTQRTIMETGELILHAGEFTVIPMQTRHENFCEGEAEMKYFCVHFDLDSPALKYLLIRNYSNQIIKSDAGIYGDLQQQAGKLINLIKPNYSLSDELDIQVNVINLIMILIRGIKEERNFVPEKEDVDQFLLCQKIANDIKTDLEFQTYHAVEPIPISITKIVNKNHISQSYALKLFKKYYFETPQEYLVSLKLTMAKSLLLQPNSLIKNVSDKLAYSAPSHFGREFKKMYNITPREYINQVKNVDTN